MLKETIQHGNLIVSTEMAHFVQAYIQYGHRPELLRKMFNKSRSTINRWLNSPEFIAEYNRQIEKGAYVCEAMCEREAPRALMSLIAQRDSLQAKVDEGEASLHEQRLLRDINNDILGYILGGKLRLEHSGNEGNPMQMQVVFLRGEEG